MSGKERDQLKVMATLSEGRRKQGKAAAPACIRRDYRDFGPTPAAEKPAERVREAFGRYPHLERHGVTVSAVAGSVYLGGALWVRNKPTIR